MVNWDLKILGLTLWAQGSSKLVACSLQIEKSNLGLWYDGPFCHVETLLLLKSCQSLWSPSGPLRGHMSVNEIITETVCSASAFKLGWMTVMEQSGMDVCVDACWREMERKKRVGPSQSLEWSWHWMSHIVLFKPDTLYCCGCNTYCEFSFL